MNIRRVLILLVCLIVMPLMAYSQGKIKGTVSDAHTGETLPGVDLILEGTHVGSITNADGNYIIKNVDPGSYVLKASYVGYKSFEQKITVQNEKTVTVNVKLSQSAINLNQVVVNGEGGPVQIKKLGNSIGMVDMKKTEFLPVDNFSNLIQGRVPGVVGLKVGGLTGAGSRIRIRGSASLSQNNEPVVYIDGVRVDNGGGFGGDVSAGGGGTPSRLDDINPEDIARVEILKGAAAATLYGTEASNGVIEIFTKKGAVGPPVFNFKIQQGPVNYPHRIKSAVGYATSQAQADTMSHYFGGSVKPYQLVSHNFANDLMTTGFSQSYTASVSGGTPGITYFTDARLYKVNGPFGGNNISYPVGTGPKANDIDQKVYLNANVNIFPTDNLQFRVTSGYTTSSLSTIDNSNNIYAVLADAEFSQPQRVSYNDRNGSPAFLTLAEATQQQTNQKVQNFNGSLGINYRPLNNLTLDATFGIDAVNQNSTHYRPFGWNINHFASLDPQGDKSFSNLSHKNYTAEIKATLDNQISDDIKSTFILGGQENMKSNELYTGTGRNFPGPGLEVIGAAAEKTLSETYSKDVNVGTFAQEQIGFRDYLFTTIGARLDANSAFGSKFHAVLYPKASVSYNPSGRTRWQPIGPISSLLLRASIGQSGLQPGAFDALTTYAPITSDQGPGIVPSNLGNPDLKPEVSTEWETGMDIGLFNDLIAFKGTYWHRTVKNVLVPRQFVVSGGFRSTQLSNIGQMKAQGVELSLNGTVIKKKSMSLHLYANGAYLWQQVTSLGGAPPIKIGGSYPRYRNFIMQGYSPGVMFGAELKQVQPGYLPVDFNGDGKPDSKAQVMSYLKTLNASNASLPTSSNVIMIENGLNSYLGKPTPDWTGAFGGSMNYKNFTLETNFEFKTGHYYVTDLTSAFRTSNPVIGRNTPQSAKVERDYVTGGVNGNYQPQNNANVRYQALKDWLYKDLAMAPFSGLNEVKKADFIRWRELSLTYRIPRRILKYYGISKMSLTAAARNLALFTKFPGVDPEVNAVGNDAGNNLTNNFNVGNPVFNWPIPRTILFTVKLTI